MAATAGATTGAANRPTADDTAVLDQHPPPPKLTSEGRLLGGYTGKGWRPGISGNPSGLAKPGGSKEALEKIRGLTDEAIATLKACLDDKRGDVRVKAAGMILDRAWGRAAHRIKLDGSITLESMLARSLGARPAAVEMGKGNVGDVGSVVVKSEIVDAEFKAKASVDTAKASPHGKPEPVASRATTADLDPDGSDASAVVVSSPSLPAVETSPPRQLVQAHGGAGDRPSQTQAKSCSCSCGVVHPPIPMTSTGSTP